MVWDPRTRTWQQRSRTNLGKAATDKPSEVLQSFHRRSCANQGILEMFPTLRVEERRAKEPLTDVDAWPDSQPQASICTVSLKKSHREHADTDARTRGLGPGPRPEVARVLEQRIEDLRVAERDTQQRAEKDRTCDVAARTCAAVAREWHCTPWRCHKSSAVKLPCQGRYCPPAAPLNHSVACSTGRRRKTQRSVIIGG